MGKLRSTKLTCVLFVVCMSTAIASPAQTFTTLFSFDGTDGSYPEASLIQATDGNFYGTTQLGGAKGGGTVFKITAAGTLTTLYNFCSQGTYPNCSDGYGPFAGLIQGTDGNFYGTTGEGGANGLGTAFKITPGAGTLTTLYSFCAQTNCADGANPWAGLIQGTNGNFYGTTGGGGASGYGTVFQITPTGMLTTLYSFCSQGTYPNCPDGYYPVSSLVQGTDGNFYGTTQLGGANQSGTVFKITPGGTLTTLHSFDGADGYFLVAGLMQATDGSFYGTTYYGGANGYGTVFKITPGGALTTLHSFAGYPTDGAGPYAGLAQATDGNFYGTTGGGGTRCGRPGCGTVYEITPEGTLATLYSFERKGERPPVGWPEGAFPMAGLVQATDGVFYGTTSEGGSNCCGTVFTFGPPAVTLSSSSFSFGDQALNETSTARTVTLTNGGTALLTISGITINGNFAISANTCTGTALTMGKKCKVSVTFTPTVLGLEAGTLSFTGNAANSPQTVVLSGTGIEPATLNPASATYVAQAVGTTSAAKTFALTDKQTVTLTNIAISTTGDFAVSSTTCTASLTEKEKCTISVTFTPTTTGTRTGQLSVSDSASNSPQASSLTGTGK